MGRGRMDLKGCGMGALGIGAMWKYCIHRDGVHR